MAGINEIYDPRINLALSRRLGMSSGPATTLAPEIQTSLDLGPMPELEFNLGWKRWQLGVIKSGLAGEFSQIQLRLNDTVDQIVIVDKIIAGAPTTDVQLIADFGYGPGVADLATSPVGVFEPRDGRQRPEGNGLVVFSKQTTAAGLTPTNEQALQMFLKAFQSAEVPGAPWILFKGNAMLFQLATSNQNLLMTFVWRARPLSPGEQQPLIAQGG